MNTRHIPGRKRGPVILPEVANAIYQAVALGASQTVAAKAGGVALSTLKAWLLKGRNGEEAYIDFLKGYEKAETKCDMSALASIMSAAKNRDWKAAAWLLARRHPEEYGEVVRQEHQLAVTGSLDLSGLSPEQLRALAYPTPLPTLKDE